jgi:hypothetical protein
MKFIISKASDNTFEEERDVSTLGSGLTVFRLRGSFPIDVEWHLDSQTKAPQRTRTGRHLFE